jgi:ligand-binding SRPBCC domain-containing protein
MSVRFSRTTVIAAPPGAVFALALNVDAHLQSMAGSGERAVAGVVSGPVGVGESVTWRARHFGVVWTMTSRVTELEEPVRFVDEQERGPFARFRHEHRFAPVDGGTEMVDDISFTAPFGPLGRLAERLVLGRYLIRLIDRRNEFLRATAEAG